MRTLLKRAWYFIPTMAVVALLAWCLHGTNVQVLNPKGWIAHKEKNLLIVSALLMLIVGIPTFILAFVVAWRYRKDNTKAKYTPDWDYSFFVESIWWGVPCIIIVILSILVWNSSHELDPFRPLNSSKKPVTIQVVALQWKWLFIYPEYNIASVNYFAIPEKTPINFEISADAPMNSFWIPQLGGQVYAMPGMRTKLHLIADTTGQFNGASANLSGKGFAGMKFITKATSQDDFDKWVESLKRSPDQLTMDEYKKLVLPSENNPVASYALRRDKLFDWIVMKYMMPMPE